MELVRLSSCIGALGFMVGLAVQPAVANDPQTIGQLHPPVIASLGDQKITVFFLQNNLKGQAREVHVPDAEIFYAPMDATKPSLNYVWKVEGGEIASVFFFERKSPERAGKSMFVLTKHNVSDSHFEGSSYSVLELPLFRDGDHLSLQFFRGDPPEPEFQNCRDGLNKEDDVEVECAYKDAASVKKRLADLDAQMIARSKLEAAHAVCPSTEFSAFLTAFSERTEVQRAFIQQPLQMVTTVAGDPEPEMQKNSLSGDQLKFPIIPNLAKREVEGLTLTVKEQRGNKATAILQKPDTDYVIEYRFVRSQCWILSEVTDFSL